MIITIDTEKNYIDVHDPRNPYAGITADLYSQDAFETISDLWLKTGWELKYPYTFSWLGFPILQIPEDMIRMQEVIFRLKPDVIVETGVAHGGSLVYYASLCRMAKHGRVVGIEKGLRCREAIETSDWRHDIMLIEGSSTDPQIVSRIHRICAGQTALIILDSDHSKAHVAAELEAYHDLVRPGLYIVACDGSSKQFAEVPRGSPEWKWNNPEEAAKEFANAHPEFVIEQPAWPFNESALTRNITYWPSAWLRRI